MLGAECEVRGGSLQEILTGQQGRGHWLQVVGATRSGRLHLSDSSHVLTTGVAQSDQISRILAAPANCLINIIKWKLVQLVSKTGEEYGVRVEEFEMLDRQEAREVIGNPKIIRVAVLQEKDSEESLKNIIVDFLENIKPEECKLSWAGKILKILKKSGRWWMCVVCKYKISHLLEGKVVSHAQAHLRYFPGYVCACQPDLVVDNLVKYKKHLQSDQHKHALELQKINSKETLSKLLNSVETHLLTVPTKNEDSEQATLEEEENVDVGDGIAVGDEENKEDISKVAEELANFMAGDLFSESWEPENSIGEYFEEDDSKSSILSDDLSKTENDTNISDINLVDEDPEEKSVSLSTRNKRKIEEILIDDEDEETEEKKSKLEEEEEEEDVKPIVPFDWYLEVGKLIELRGKSFYCKDPSCWSSKSFGNQSVITHIEKYHFKNVDVFRCGECGVDCNSLHNHNAHMRMQHQINLTVVKKEENNSVTAEECFALLEQSVVYNNDRTTGSTWELEVKRRITQQGDGYGCSECSFLSSPVGQGGKNEILGHVEKCHLNIAGYHCPQCRTTSDCVTLFSHHLALNHNLHLHLLQHLDL